MVKTSRLVSFLVWLCGLGYGQTSDGKLSAEQTKTLADAAWARAGCGSDSIRFDVKMDKAKHPVPRPEPGKAMVYVFEDDQTRAGFPTIRVGVDGKWMGGNVPDSYFFFSVDPGIHRLCSNWQGIPRVGNAVDFNADAGKIYYFRATIRSFQNSSFEDDDFKLKEVSNAEGEFLIASHALSTSHEKVLVPVSSD